MGNKPSLVFIAVFLSALLALSGTAHGDCTPDDGNNVVGNATPIGHADSVSGVVCPDDPFDFYTFDIQDGSDVSGRIEFSSPQVSTVIRVYHDVTGDRIIDDKFTNETTKDYVFTFDQGSIPPGTYYIRIFHWSNAAYDHDYTLTMDLTGEEEEPVGLLLQEMYFMYRSPWPTPRAYASNTGRSGCAGPSGLIELKNSAELTPLIEDRYSDTRYDGLAIGPDDSIYIVKTDTKMLYVYKPGSASVETFSTGSARPPCFDVTGNMYVIERQGQTLAADLVCYNEFPSDEAWRQTLPAGTEHSIMAVGDQIYTRTCGSQNSVQAWDKSGNRTCNINLPSPAAGVAEDALNERFFIQISESLYKLDYTGGQEWVVEGPGASYYEGENEVWNALGPIVEWDGDVWVTNEGRELWKVFKPDGTEYKKGGSPIITGMPDGFSTAAVSAALGSNRLFYRALTGGGGDTVECHSDWDQPVWSTRISGYITDMVLDSANHIYIGCVNAQDPDNTTYEWQCLDPVDGHVIMTVTCSGVPSDICWPYRRVELAIGGDNRLIFLHKHGYVAIYGERQLEKELYYMENKESSGKPIHGMRRKEG